VYTAYSGVLDSPNDNVEPEQIADSGPSIAVDTMRITMNGRAGLAMIFEHFLFVVWDDGTCEELKLPPQAADQAKKTA
jgi:hypothetical protein